VVYLAAIDLTDIKYWWTIWNLCWVEIHFISI